MASIPWLLQQITILPDSTIDPLYSAAIRLLPFVQKRRKALDEKQRLGRLGHVDQEALAIRRDVVGPLLYRDIVDLHLKKALRLAGFDRRPLWVTLTAIISFPGLR